MAQHSATIEELLATLGLASFNDVFIDRPSGGDPENTQTELELDVCRRLKELTRNARPEEDAPIFLGAGSYDRRIPLAVKSLVGKADLYSAYRSNQAETARSMLEALAEFRRNVCSVTGMEVADASAYCGGTALGHACALAAEAVRRRIVVVPATIGLDQARVLEAYARVGLFELRVIPEESGLVDLTELENVLNADGFDVAAVVVPYPNFYGLLERVAKIASLAKKQGAVVIMAADLVSLTALKSPKEWGADMVVSDCVPHGSPVDYNKIHVGFVAVSRKLFSILPERVVRSTVDEDGVPVPVLTMRSAIVSKTPEQAPRLAPSPEILSASIALAYYAFVNVDDMKQAAAKGYRVAKYAREELAKAGFKFHHSTPFLHEFAVKVDDPRGMNAYLLKWGIVGGCELDDGLILAFTEKRTPEEVDELVYFMKTYQFGAEN